MCVHLFTSPYIEVMLQFTLAHSLSLLVTEWLQLNSIFHLISPELLWKDIIKTEGAEGGRKALNHGTYLFPLDTFCSPVLVGTGGDRGCDRRWRKRLSGTEESRHRRCHGDRRFWCVQAGGWYDPAGRQLRFHRHRSGGGWVWGKGRVSEWRHKRRKL